MTKIPKNYYSQFIYMNREEFYQVITAFNELNEVCDNQICLYLDMYGWEVFDQRVGKTIIKHTYKHVRDLRLDILYLKHAMITVGCYLVSRKAVTSSVTSARKRLERIYSINELNLIYPNYESRKEVEAMANRH